MPRLNGIEAATRIRAFLPDSRIVLFSGQASSMELLEDAHADVQQFEISCQADQTGGTAENY